MFERITRRFHRGDRLEVVFEPDDALEPDEEDDEKGKDEDVQPTHDKPETS